EAFDAHEPFIDAALAQLLGAAFEARRRAANQLCPFRHLPLELARRAADCRSDAADLSRGIFLAFFGESTCAVCRRIGQSAEIGVFRLCRGGAFTVFGCHWMRPRIRSRHQDARRSCLWVSRKRAW